MVFWHKVGNVLVGSLHCTGWYDCWDMLVYTDQMYSEQETRTELEERNFVHISVFFP